MIEVYLATHLSIYLKNKICTIFEYICMYLNKAPILCPYGFINRYLIKV